MGYAFVFTAAPEKKSSTEACINIQFINTTQQLRGCSENISQNNSEISKKNTNTVLLYTENENMVVKITFFQQGLYVKLQLENLR